MVTFSRFAYPIAAFLFVAVAFVLPILRVERRTGVFPITFSRNTEERPVLFLLALSAAGIGAWTAAYAALGPEALGVWPSPSWLIAVGWLLVAVGLVVTSVAQTQMGASWRIGIDREPTALVTGGLYRFTRNPIYTGIFIALAGYCLVSPSLWLGLMVSSVYVLVAAQTRREEQHLLRMHGDSFRQWAARVGRFLPGIGRLR